LKELVGLRIDETKDRSTILESKPLKNANPIRGSSSWTEAIESIIEHRPSIFPKKPSGLDSGFIAIHGEKSVR
jgi:hypothetical protein